MIRLELLLSPGDRTEVIEALRPLLNEDDRLVESAASFHPGLLADRPLREQVSGRVEQVLLLLYLAAQDADAALNAIGALHLQHPLRWTCQPVATSGTLGA